MTLQKRQPFLHLGFAVVALVLALVPLARITYLVFSAGTNNPSNDDIEIVDFLGRYWDGNYDWKKFPGESFAAGHAFMLPALVYLVNAHLTGLDIYVLLVFGLFLAAVKLLLFHNAIVWSGPKGEWYGPWLLLVTLSALVFSVAHINAFEFSFTSVVNGLYKLGFAIVIWALVRFPKQWKGVGIALTGAMISTFSSGVLAWPILFIGMVVLGFRRPLHYATVIAGAVLASLPYVLNLKPQAIGQGNLSPFNAKIVLNMLGRPFANGTGTHFGDLWVAIWVAFGGVVLMTVGLFVMWTLRRRAPVARFAPAILLLSFGLLFCWQVSFVRVSIAPWYGSNAMDFWIGLVALAYLIWAFRKTPVSTSGEAKSDHLQRGSLTGTVATVWPVITVLAIAVLFVYSNRTYLDKSFFMWTRAPASVACLQQYKIAPTYCGPLVHRFAGVPNVMEKMAGPLEKGGLSVFDSPRTWTLQGDSILPTVRYSDLPGVPETRWSSDLSANGVPITDYRELDLLIYPSNFVNWTVTLPQSLKEARFYSGISLSSSPPTLKAADRLQAVVSVLSDQSEQSLFSQHLTADQRDGNSFSFDLTQYAGKTITLKLAIVMEGNANGGAWAVFRHPHVKASWEGTNHRETSASVVPHNTESSPYRVDPTPDDFRFDLTRQEIWDVIGLTRNRSGTDATEWVSTGATMIKHNAPLNLPLADYSHFYVRMSASINLQPRSFALAYVIRDAKGTVQRHQVIVPLLADAKMHSYTFDLRLNGPRFGFDLAEIELIPSYGSTMAGVALNIADIRLIAAKPRASHADLVSPPDASR